MNKRIGRPSKFLDILPRYMIGEGRFYYAGMEEDHKTPIMSPKFNSSILFPTLAEAIAEKDRLFGENGFVIRLAIYLKVPEAELEEVEGATGRKKSGKGTGKRGRPKSSPPPADDEEEAEEEEDEIDLDDEEEYEEDDEEEYEEDDDDEEEAEEEEGE